MKASAVFFITIILLLGLPLLSVLQMVTPFAILFEFPPTTLYVKHAGVSMEIFLIYSIAILICLILIGITAFKRYFQNKKHQIDLLESPLPKTKFPWWGKLSMLVILVSWILAWNRFSWMTVFQRHTFIPLWFGFIVAINAMTFRRTHKCLMVNQSGYFLVLFPVSAVFWWFFEYLNRFVQNWSYVGETLDPVQYLIYGTLSFSTVLPAVISMSEFLASFSLANTVFKRFINFHVSGSKNIAIGIFGLSSLGLSFIGRFPNILFSLLWLAPLCLVLSIQVLTNREHILKRTLTGDWREIMLPALAALICGFFWEMWNFYSYTKWIYHIPYVDRLRIFEMPLLGYAGYLPFGIECAVLAKISQSWIKTPSKQII